jgi:hypothetical protein
MHVGADPSDSIALFRAEITYRSVARSVPVAGWGVAMKLSALSILLLLLLAPLESRAGDPLEDFPDGTAAQRLLDEARALMRKNRYGQACSKLAESLRIEPTAGTQFKLADCNEQIGKVATAWAGFLDVATRANAANETERETIARRRAQSLVPRLPKLVIDVPNVVPGLEVKRDAVAIDAGTFGAAIPVDPGAHRITATAPGKPRWVTTVHCTEGTTARVELPRELPSARVPEPQDPATSLDDGAPRATPRDPATSLDDGAPDASDNIAARATIAGAAALLAGLAALEDSGTRVLRGSN